MTTWLVKPRNIADPRDRGYTIVVQLGHPTAPGRAWFASCRIDAGQSWRGRYGPTPDVAERRLRDWIEASG